MKTAEDFNAAFERAFYNPNKQRAAKQKITLLTQTTTMAAYTTKFRSLLISFDWNNAALQAQFYKGLHWHVKQQLAQKEDQLWDLEALIATAVCIDNVCQEFKISQPARENRAKSSTTTTQTPGTGIPQVNSDWLKSDPNYVSETEHQCCQDEKMCIKCRKAGHQFAECLMS
jgi:hypothetical protein